MKGVNGTLVEEVVRVERGDDRWDEIVDDAGGPGADTSLGSHADRVLVDLAETVATHVGPRCGQRVRVEQPLRRHRSAVVCVLRVTCP